jgi:hypothetical protein
MAEIVNFLLILPLLLSIIGLYFVVRIWLVWNKIDPQVLKARVFLSEKFLIKNWVYVFLTGAFITSHVFMDSLRVFTGMISEPITELIGHLLHLLAIVMLVILAFEWYKIINTIVKK